MGKITSYRPQKLDPGYSSQTSWNANRPQQKSTAEADTLTAFILAHDKVEFCRNFRNSGLTNNAKAQIASKITSDDPNSLKELDSECEMVLNEHNSFNRSHQKKKVESGIIGPFLGTVKKNSFSKMWRSAVNAWGKARASGLNIFKSAAVAIKEFFGTRTRQANRMSDSDLPEFNKRIKSFEGAHLLFIEAIISANNVFLDSSKHFNFTPVIRINDHLKLDMFDDDITTSEASDVIAKLSDKSMADFVKTLGEHYTNWVFDRVLPNITSQAKELRNASENGNRTEINESLKKLRLINFSLRGICDQFSNFIHLLQDMVKFAKENTSFDSPEDLAKLEELDQEFMYIRGIIHDTINFIGYTSGIVELYDINANMDDIASIFDSVDELDLSKLNNNIVTAASMHNSIAIEKGISIAISDKIPPINNIPNDMLRMIFRTTSELVLNAIKYSDPAKQTHWITVDAVKIDQLIDIVVEDNGVGIKDTESVLMHGNRERPDLAKGTGTGLAALSDLAKKKGLTLSVESRLGKGSIISLRGINPGKWSSNSSSNGNNHDDSIGNPPASGGNTKTVNKTNIATPSDCFAGFIQKIKTNNPKSMLQDDETSVSFDLSTSIFNYGTCSLAPVTPARVTTPSAIASTVGR